MALSMHTNYASLVTQNNLNRTNDLLNTSMERLSTGLRINSAADDAAGLQISNRLEAQTRGMSVAMRNAQDGISMLQTAEGAMDEMTNIAYRMNDLALQSANGTNTQADRDALDAEYQQLGAELNNIIDNTNFGGQNLFGATGVMTGTLDFQIGSTNAERMTFDLTNGGTSTAMADLKTFAGAIGDLKSDATAQTATQAISENASNLIGNLGEMRAQFGATINRLDHTVTNLQNMSENLSASKGRITDADFAVESANMTKNQMLMQAGTQMLAQSKQLPGMAMSLLG
ncbi:lateral flagellin LafA [Vibrio chaetopteri]|uniref:Flagellin n=1 Tax=Vibrio chaetopteri TaxID=3016528 RepID=A0AAU8BHH8_9VIBR